MGLRFFLLAWNGMGDGQVKLNLFGFAFEGKEGKERSWQQRLRTLYQNFLFVLVSALSINILIPLTQSQTFGRQSQYSSRRIEPKSDRAGCTGKCGGLHSYQ